MKTSTIRKSQINLTKAKSVFSLPPLKIQACSYMAEFKIGRLDGQPPRIRNVPIAVTPEGFWCCPSQAALQKTARSPNHQDRPRGGASPAPSKASSVQRAPTISSEKRAQSTPARSRTNSDEQICPPADAIAAPDPPKVAPAPAHEK